MNTKIQDCAGNVRINFSMVIEPGFGVRSVYGSIFCDWRKKWSSFETVRSEIQIWGLI
jgi:hypothetical protein